MVLSENSAVQKFQRDSPYGKLRACRILWNAGFVATQAVSPKPTGCAEKLNLFRAFIEAVHDIMVLQDRQLAARISGLDGLDRFDLAIKHARRKREKARKLYLIHLLTHGC